jgi:hypothetical protein
MIFYIALNPLKITYPIMYNVENINATTVMKILKNAESELPADHARDAAYIEIVREMMN